MRIAIDCRKLFDFGIGTYIRGLVHALAEVAAADEEYIAIAPERAREHLPSRFEFVRLETPNYSVGELWSLGRAIDRARADLFHAPHFVLPWTTCPSVATLHDVIFFNHPSSRNPVAFAYVAAMTARAARKSARIVTVSHASRDALVATFDFPSDKIRVTPNGIDERFFRAGEAASFDGRPYFLFVGNDKPHKNVAALVAAFADVRKSEHGLVLRLAGGRFERFHQADAIEAAGFVGDDQLAALYRGAVAVVVPSLEEGFGLPAAEAMACGTPVITSTAPALVEVTADAALHVDPRSPAALAEAMLRVLRDDSLRKRLSAAGQVRARAFTWKRCAEATAAVYREVLAQRSVSR